VLLEYMASIRGAMREQTRQEAQQRRDKAVQWQVAVLFASCTDPDPLLFVADSASFLVTSNEIFWQMFL
jgi:hypothetical protein